MQPESVQVQTEQRPKIAVHKQPPATGGREVAGAADAAAGYRYLAVAPPATRRGIFARQSELIRELRKNEPSAPIEDLAERALLVATLEEMGAAGGREKAMISQRAAEIRAKGKARVGQALEEHRALITLLRYNEGLSWQQVRQYLQKFHKITVSVTHLRKLGQATPAGGGK